jgi:hypothetical protein
MNKLDPHTLFFGNYVDSDTEFDILEEYLNEINVFLRNPPKVKRNESLKDSIKCFVDQHAELYEEIFPNIIFQSYIISIVMLLEQIMKSYCSCLQESLNIKLSLRDLSGSLTDRFYKYCTKLGNMSFSSYIETWSDIKSIYEIRNCIVHSNGNIKDFHNSKTIQIFSDKYDLLKVSDHNFLIIDYHVSFKILSVCKEFTEHIYNSALNVFKE